MVDRIHMENVNLLSIVLPCYNEQDNLPALFERLDKVVLKHESTEIILVNNGSTDNSEKVFEQELGKRNKSRFRVVSVEKNIGYGFGILSGLRAAKGNILSYTHADRQTDPLDVLAALDIYEKEGHPQLLVKGYRKNRKKSEALFSAGMGLLASVALGTRLTEINAQPKLFSRTFFDSVEKTAPHDFSLDLYLLYQAQKHGKIRDFPVFFSKRVAGEAKGGSGSTWKVKWKLIRRSYKYILELRGKLKNNHQSS
jgi:glycosyltransferase involved in cell wall biosynthesis